MMKVSDLVLEPTPGLTEVYMKDSSKTVKRMGRESGDDRDRILPTST